MQKYYNTLPKAETVHAQQPAKQAQQVQVQMEQPQVEAKAKGGPAI